MEEQESTDFKINTLRRRQEFLIKKLEDDSAGSKRFNKWEINALQSATTALQNEARYEKVSGTLVDLVTTLVTGDQDELVTIVDTAKDVIDKYKL